VERVLENSNPTKVQKLLALLWPRPDCGSFPVDLFHLILLAIIETTVVPHKTLGLFRIDILSPWLFVFFVFGPLHKTLPLAILGGLLQETRSTAPAGMYISAYWSVAVTIHYIRHTLSWRHVGPWSITLLSYMAWIISFETLVIAVSQDVSRLNFNYAINQTLRAGLATVIGLLFAKTSGHSLPPEDQI
jgi:hypothetical protein